MTYTEYVDIFWFMYASRGFTDSNINNEPRLLRYDPVDQVFMASISGIRHKAEIYSPSYSLPSI